MTKLWLPVLFVVVSTIAATTVAKKLAVPYQLSGKVYCDTCRFGFETNITTYIPGAVVQLQCNDKSNTRLVFSNTTKTDENGKFTFQVYEDHGDQYCDVVLISSPWPHCKIIDQVRKRSRVIVTNLNGISTYLRHANNLGVFQDYALPQCAALYRYFFHSDDI
ncbi:pollen-specific protein C13-like [Amaranthus tricolor]|uniref:pollen-specific protein C13-like n=1 Tax=Amaranthus tricolor TaxID=29722 RepID=UPI0025826BFE|nr:pollen-specific protein C13-like [Amaranthus tricolor]